MKSQIQNLAMLSAVIAFASCNTAKTETKAEIPTETTVNASDSTAVEETPKAEIKTVEGKVQEIQKGKDGYTAKIETQDKEVYFVTISHSNLKDHTQYRNANIGEIIKVSGDFWKMENENHITVREIQ